MKVLMEIVNNNYMAMNSTAKRLKELYPDSQFAAIVRFNQPDEHIYDYLANQEDIKYEFLHDHHKTVRESLQNEIDYDVLRKFEETCPEKTIWRYICADREWGIDFMHGVISYKTYYNQQNSHENILRVCSGLVKAYKKIFDEFQPDIFLPAMAMGGMTVSIFEQLCRDHNIPYIVSTPARILDIFAFSDDVQLRFPQINQTYQQLMNDTIIQDMSEAEQLYTQLMGELEDSSYFDRNNPCFDVKTLDTLLAKFKFFLSTIKAMGGAFKRWLFFRRKFKDVPKRRKVYNLATLWSMIIYALKHKYQNYIVLRSSFGELLKPEQKYLFYPLHLNPEYSTQVMGKMWLDQINLVEQLAKSVPSDWIVYVKEHPATLAYRTRPTDFYKRLKQIPNVRFAPINLDSHYIIMGAEMVAVITGTAGWEAVQRGKPLITFADNFWDIMGLSRKYTSIENLSRDIHDEIVRLGQISDDERQRRITCYLAAVLEHGFRITYPEQFNYEPGTPEQYELSGREAADALKKHLDYLQENKDNAQYSKPSV